MEAKCRLIDKYSVAREKCTGIGSSLDGARHERQSFNIPSLSDTYRKVTRTYWMLKAEVTSLVLQLKKDPHAQGKIRSWQ